MAYLIRSLFAFWYGTLLSLGFAGVKNTRRNRVLVYVFFIFQMALQGLIGYFFGESVAEKMYPLITHFPLWLCMCVFFGVRWEVSAGVVFTAYLCCEIPSWMSTLCSIPFGSDYNIEVMFYCVSSVLVLGLLLKYAAKSVQGILMKSKQVGLTFGAIPLMYYIWCYATTVYTEYLQENGYRVAIMMSAMFALSFLLLSITQFRHQEAIELMKELEQLKNAEQEAKISAMRANQAKGEFLANMSHEIRTPLNAVLGLDEMILRECDDLQILDYAHKIKALGQTLLSLINDVLDMSKIDSGRMEIILAEYNPQEMISDVLVMIESRTEGKGLKLKYDIDESLPIKLFGDDKKLRQVLLNMLTNAVKYTEKGFVTLQVGVNYKTENRVSLHFSVKDTGIGIKEEDQKYIYEAFSRVDINHNRNIEGTGLGLNITLKLLQLMKSNLNVNSVYGEGSDFYFDIEQEIIDATEIGVYEPMHQGISAKDVYREGFWAPNAKILVVDDYEMNLLVFKGLIKNSKMDIQTVTSGMEALERIRTEFFDIVFLDHFMPEMDGIETLQRIQGDEGLRQNAPVVIALTANAIAGAEEAYMEAGFCDYLQKPINGPKLEKVICDYLPPDKVVYVNSEETKVRKEIDQSIGLQMCGGDIRIYREVLKAFMMSGFLENMQKYMDNEEWENYKIIVHGLKSGAKSIGAMELSEEAKEAELAWIENKDTGLMKKLHPLLIENTKHVIREIEEMI